MLIVDERRYFCYFHLTPYACQSLTQQMQNDELEVSQIYRLMRQSMILITGALMRSGVEWLPGGGR